MVDRSRAMGAIYGAAVGDALGMPIEGLSHQNVRTYYKGIRRFEADEKRGDLAAGQWTYRTQLALWIGDSMAEDGQGPPAVGALSLRRLGNGARPAAGSGAGAVTPVAVRAACSGWSPDRLAQHLRDVLGSFFPTAESLAAAFGQAHAVRTLLVQDPEALSGSEFLVDVAEATAWAEERLSADGACSRRLADLVQRLDSFPLDLQEACGGTGFAADEAWPFAVAMVARNASLVEATMLSAINVGGDAPTVGACVGAMLGALHGVEAFPPSWVAQVEGRPMLDRLLELVLE